jgi:hypothetical protein
LSVEVRDLVGGWAAGNLTPEERRALARAALEDQEIFDQLASEEPLRDLIADPRSRAALLEALETRPGPGVLRWFPPQRAWALAAAATLAIAALGIYLFLRPATEPGVRLAAAGPLSAPEAASPPMRHAPGEYVFTLRGEAPGRAELQLDRGGPLPTYAPGDPLRLGFRVSAPASVVVVEVREAERQAVVLFPNRWSPSARVEGGKLQLVPPEGAGNLQVTGRPGHRVLLLLAYSPDVDPLASPEPPDSLPLLATTRLELQVLPPPGATRGDR